MENDTNQKSKGHWFDLFHFEKHSCVLHQDEGVVSWYRTNDRNFDSSSKPDSFHVNVHSSANVGNSVAENDHM